MPLLLVVGGWRVLWRKEEVMQKVGLVKVWMATAGLDGRTVDLLRYLGRESTCVQMLENFI